MFFTKIVFDVLNTRLMEDLGAFLPELVLCGGIVLMLLIRLLSRFNDWHLGWVALFVSLGALLVAGVQWTMELAATPLFSHMLMYDTYTIYLRLFLIGFTALLIALSLLTGIPDREDSADFYALLLGATVGMSLMASANHLLMVYIGVEMASLPSYALAGFLKGRRRSSEASLKYVVYGGGASGIMLYGISLIAGKFGTGFLPDVAVGYMAVLRDGGGIEPVLLLGTLFILIGLAFKLAAVPFHFWCPDVFEGAAAEVAAFLSVASKAAALALLGRIALTLVGLAESNARVENWLAVARVLAPAIGVLAAVTATFGNLAAYPQTNLKRLLAYSTIAHAGYMMMGIAPLTQEGMSAVLFYLIAYLFMNLGAFAIVAFLRNRYGSEDLRDFRGLIQQAPLMTVLLAVFLLSLLGIPPLAGFAAKFQIFSVLYHSGEHLTASGQRPLGTLMYTLLVVGAINTVFSAVYYLKVVKVMVLDRPEAAEPGQAKPEPGGPAFYGTVLAAMIFVVFLAWNQLADASDKGVQTFQKGFTVSKAKGGIRR